MIKMAKETIIIEGLRITLYRKNIKNMYLRIQPPTGEVKVSAPAYMSDKDIANFIRSKREWILKKQKLILDKKIKAPLKYKSGEKHYLWGNEYTLQLVKNDNVKQGLIDGDKSIIYLPVPDRSTIEKRKNLVDKF